MSYEIALPSSLHLEIEAQRLHSSGRTAGFVVTAFGAALCGFPQALDLFIWAFAAVAVFPDTLFAGLGRPLAIAAGLLLWLVAYGVAPLGSWISRKLSGRYGRGAVVTAARFVLGGATVSVALLPIAPSLVTVALLAGCRLAQGIAIGALPQGRADRRLTAAAWSIAGLAGLAFATGLYAGFGAILDRADFLDWGWRYAFVLGLPINIVALFADLRLMTSEPPGARGSAVRLASVGGVRLNS